MRFRVYKPFRGGILNMARRKRKEIVNYCVKSYDRGRFHIVNLIIGRNHPFFKFNNSFITLYVQRSKPQFVDYWSVTTSYGHEVSYHHYCYCKQKFRNLNFKIIRFVTGAVGIQQVRDYAKQLRFDLIMEYIKEKRKEEET